LASLWEKEKWKKKEVGKSIKLGKVGSKTDEGQRRRSENKGSLSCWVIYPTEKRGGGKGSVVGLWGAHKRPIFGSPTVNGGKEGEKRTHEEKKKLSIVRDTTRSGTRGGM